MQTRDSSAFSRRDFLHAGAIGGALLLSGRPSESFGAEGDDPYRGFRMGLQSYSLRGFKVEKALEVTKKLGLHFWEAYPGHIPMTTVPKQVAEEKELLKGSDVTMTAYG